MQNGYRVSFSSVKRLEDGDEHKPHLTQRLKEVQSYLSSPILPFTTCSTVNFIFAFMFRPLKQIGKIINREREKTTTVQMIISGNGKGK
jgi:hypothetical protein